jgi:type II secretory pathway component GspD/PulD (secretin)
MKKIIPIILIAGLSSLLAVRAQTNPVAGSQPEGTNAALAPTATVADVATNEIPSATITNVPPTVAGAAVEVLVTDTNTATVAGGPIIPLVHFADVPITTAIESLTRQAGINYMLDPKIGYGQPDQNGQIRAEPTLSIRWESITPERALLALLDNYNLQLVHDKNTGIDRITLKDPLAPPLLMTRVVQLKYSDAAKMTEAVQSVLTDKRSKVLPDGRTSQLIVVATEPEQTAVDTLVVQLDKPTKQVLIETRLVEISSNPKTKKGVDWTQTLQAQNVTFGNGFMDSSKSKTTISDAGISGTPTPGGGYVPPSANGSSQNTVLELIQGAGGISGSTASGLIPTTGFLNADGLHAVLSFLNTSSDAQIVSTPRVVTLDNEKATISVTRGYPVFQVQAGTQNTAGGSQVSYTNVGPVLEVTPRISANDYIWLKVSTHVDSYFGEKSQNVSGGSGGGGQTLTAPLFDFRKIETQVFIPNANTLVMGGLVQDKPQANYTKVPLLGDIPGLGWAFRSEDKSLDKQNLLIFITPTIVKDSDFQPSNSGDFLKSKPESTMKSPMNPNKAWDNARPGGNWSNPVPVPGEFDPVTK